MLCSAPFRILMLAAVGNRGIAPARRVVSKGKSSPDTFGNSAFDERLQNAVGEVGLHSLLDTSLNEHLQKISEGERSHSLLDASINERLQERGEEISGLLPPKLLDAVRAVRWLWAGSASVLSVRSIYVALQVYKERRTFDADIVQAFTRSRIIAYEEAHKHQLDDKALVDIFSVDSLSALRTFVDTSARIAQTCGGNETEFGDVLKQHAEDAQKVYDALRGEVCRGLAQEVEDYTQKANALAQEYWKRVADPELYGFQRTLYYTIALRHRKVYIQDFSDEWDIGKPPVDEIDRRDFESDCQPCDLEQCSAKPGELDGSNYSDEGHPGLQATSPSADAVAQEFEQITKKVKLLLTGMRDEGCPLYTFNECTRRVMLCTYSTRAMLQALEANWEAVQQASEAGHASTRASKRKRWWIVRRLKAFVNSRIVKVGMVALADLGGWVALFLHRFRRRIWELLHASRMPLEVQMVFELFWANDAMNVGSPAQGFVKGANKELSATLFSNKKYCSMPIMAEWLQGFSWLAVEHARAVDVSDACEKAAVLLQSGGHVNTTEAQAMAIDSL